MAARRHPEYEFFVGGPPATASRTAAPAQAPTAADDADWAPLGPRLAWSPSTPARHTAAAVPTVRAPSGGPVARPARPARTRSVRFAAGLTVAVPVVTALGAATGLLAVRILGPSGERAVWAVTRVSVPPTLDGLRQVRSGPLDALGKADQARLRSVGAGALRTEVAFYAVAGPRPVEVVAGRPELPLDADRQDAVRQGLTAALARAAVTLTSRPPGPLGGWWGCGVSATVTKAGTGAAAATTVCVAVDAGAVLSVTVPGTGPRALAQARRVREVVERRD